MDQRNIVKELALDPKNKHDLFTLLNVVTMSAAKIRADNAMQGAKAIIAKGLTTPDKMLSTPYWDKVKILNQNGYARFDESRARFFEENAKLVNEKYDGDLHKMLAAAGHKADKVKELSQEFKGIGPMGAEMFVREVKPHIKLGSLRLIEFGRLFNK